MVSTSKTTRARSRNGCENCKKLKIKCDELKPSCEYCNSTGRDCVYLPPKKITRQRTKPNDESILVVQPSADPFNPQNLFVHNTKKYIKRKYVRGRYTIKAPPSRIDDNDITNTPYIGSRSSSRTSSYTSLNTMAYAITPTSSNMTYAMTPNSSNTESSEAISHSFVVDLVNNHRLGDLFLETNPKLGIAHVAADPNLFEERLLKLLKLYLPGFIPVMPGSVSKFMLTEIPVLFRRSKVIQNGLYAFCCINSWNLIHMEDPTIGDFINPITNIFRSSQSHDMIYDYQLTIGSDKNLYENTVSYFLSLISSTNDIIISLVNVDEIKDEDVAKELMFACFSIFLHLGMHSHNLVPLANLSFNEDYVQDFDELINLSNDLLTIGSTLDKFMKLAINSLPNLKSDFQFFKFFNTSLASFPIITQLMKNLDFYYSELYFYSDEYKQDLNYDILQRHAVLLQHAFTIAFMTNRGLPFYKFYMIIDDNFRDLVRLKNPIALEIMFIYSFMCLHVRFCVFHDKNLWVDYMNWYKDWNFYAYGEWKYKLDDKLYNVKHDEGHDVRYYLDLDLGD